MPPSSWSSVRCSRQPPPALDRCRPACRRRRLDVQAVKQLAS
jgi:hypothetical protein